ncbi:MAG TPA: hypothetical protein VF952_04220 [Chloroflexia bacterium]
MEHLAIDGSIITVEADADLSTRISTTGWAIVPSLMRAHPFAVYPAGYTASVEKAVRRNNAITRKAVEDYDLKGGKLRVAEVRMATATGGFRDLTVGAWEGKSGCLTTSMVGTERERLIEVFDTLQFSERSAGVAIDSPITPQPREPQVIKEIPGLGVLNIQPAIHSTLQGIPRMRGLATNTGELFRIREGSNALIFVSPTSVVRIDPLTEADSREMLAMTQSLRVEWSPRSNR